MPRSHKGHKYILCIIDEVTNYLIVVPIFQARSEEIGEALIENVINSISKLKLKLKFLVYSVLEPAVGYLTTLHFNSQQGTHPTLV